MLLSERYCIILWHVRWCYVFVCDTQCTFYILVKTKKTVQNFSKKVYKKNKNKWLVICKKKKKKKNTCQKTDFSNL